MEETTVTIDLGKDDIRIAATIEFNMGVQMLYDILKSTF